MLAIDHLQVALDADAGLVKAIDGLSLAITRGETFALVGESGCGKSMTALALMRLLPDNGAVIAGSVALEGTDVLALPESQMRAVRGGRIGMIFQEPATSLNPVMRVGDQIVEAIEAHTELRGAAARERALHWLRKVGIPEPERRIDDYPFRMSGGQKQRVMIALTLAAEPDFLIADEPTTALDVTIQAQILDLLRDLQREQGMGLLLITHDLAVVSGMAHRVALMYAGQIVEVATADDFFARPLHPVRAALLRALPDAQRRAHALEAIAGTVPALTRTFAGCRFSERCARRATTCAHTVPELLQTQGRLVRCLRYASDTPWPASGRRRCDRRRGARRSTVPARMRGAERRAAMRGRCCCRSRDLSVRFPIRRGVLQRRARRLRRRARRQLQHRCGPHAGAGRRVGLRQDHHRQGDRAAAAGARPRSTARRCSRAATCSRCEGDALRTCAARCRSSSRTRIRRSTRACAWARSSRKGCSRCAPTCSATSGASAWRSCCDASACATTRCRAIRTSSPAGSASASRSRARWRCSPS